MNIVNATSDSTKLFVQIEDHPVDVFALSGDETVTLRHSSLVGERGEYVSVQKYRFANSTAYVNVHSASTFRVTMSADTTITLADYALEEDQVQRTVLYLIGNYNTTWPVNILWNEGIAPTPAARTRVVLDAVGTSLIFGNFTNVG